jgi:SPP1 family predicted phage head-tail adaptor
MRPLRPQSGRLRQFVTWQTPSSAPADGSCGQEVTTWTTQGTFWAEVVSLDGSEPFDAGQLKATRPQRITMRNLGQAIAAGHRLVFEGRNLVVNSVRRDRERAFWLEILAVEQAQGTPGGP